MSDRSQDEAAKYWAGGYTTDPDAAANAPSAYLPSYVDLLQRQSFSEELVRRCNEVKPRSVFEVGCNAGRNLWVLSERFPLERVSAVDINPSALEYLRAHAPAGGWDLHCRDVIADGLPPVEGPIDVVFSMAVLVHMQPGAGKARLVKQMWELAGRRLILIEPHGSPKNISEDRTKSPFWVDDYKRYLPQLRDLGPARSGSPDSLDGIPIGRAPKAAGRLARRLVEMIGRSSIYRVLIADKPA